ncbi:ABC transporter permease [Parafrankia sp. BMG5.11]|uniref:ABC transporter permease n=1 Tax=Parafrankia sp. BMG5.11 TaxID=222540 RepID=UPI000DA525B5|nr:MULTISPECIES: ABC transporter permease [unclassified Parafrankia]TCJ36712.1 molybdate ABC transporter permease subunit [Parafrankia sp. BMG5.11]SQE00192.1 Molybdate ABC transporter, inner membrane subunit [Parafrankia sp. Ea1.12]
MTLGRPARQVAGSTPPVPAAVTGGVEPELPRRGDGAGRGRRGSRGARREVRVRAPWPLAVPAALATVFLLLPLVALIIRAPWEALPDLLSDPSTGHALWLSVRTATVTTVLCVLFGVPLAWALARGSFPGRGLLRALVTIPLVLPPVVGGVSLLLVLGRRGLVGNRLDDWFGVTIPFTTNAVIIAQTFVALPFLVLSVEGALSAADRRFEDAAATLGAGRATAFFRVTLPMVAPAVAAGAVLSWARALGEFGATITFAGNFPKTTQTMPLSVYLAMETDPDAAVALSLVLLVVSIVVLVALRGHWWDARRTQRLA